MSIVSQVGLLLQLALCLKETDFTLFARCVYLYTFQFIYTVNLHIPNFPSGDRSDSGNGGVDKPTKT